MKKSFIFLSDGFEEIEALAVIDILRRADMAVVTISMNSVLEVTSSRGVKVIADALYDNNLLIDADYLILPGGSTRLNEYPELKKMLLEHNNKNGMIAAICAAPMVLGGLGLLNGKRATCYPGFEQYLEGAIFVNEKVVIDGNIITGNGPASALAFGFAIVEHACGKDVSARIMGDMIY